MSKEPPQNKSPEAVRLRMAATEWGKNVDEVAMGGDAWSKKLNRELLMAALAYANAVYHSQPIVRHETKVKTEPDRWQCALCKRDNFTRRCGHKCVGGYRKRHLKWIAVFDQPKEPDAKADGQ